MDFIDIDEQLKINSKVTSLHYLLFGNVVLKAYTITFSLALNLKENRREISGFA